MAFQDEDEGSTTRKTKVRNLPRAIRELEEDDPLLTFKDPQHAAHINFVGKNPSPCVIFTGSPEHGKWLPVNAESNKPGVHLTFKISGAAFAKRFTISAKVAGSNVTKLRESSLKFFAGEPGQIENLSFAKRASEDVGQFFSQKTEVYVISWTTSGGYRSGLETEKDYDQESTTTFQTLKSFSTDILFENTSIHLVVADVPGLAKELRNFSSTSFKTPWAPYLDTTGAPKCSWGAFPKRVDVDKQCGHLIPLPAQNTFATVEEAHVLLANGILLEYRQLSALENLWAGDAAQRWWPTLLNQSVESLTVHDPFESLDSRRTAIEQTWAAVENALPWDKHQNEALRASRTLTGRTGVIEGGAGSGKTAVLAGTAVSYAHSGCPVILFAPMVSQARALAQEVERVIAQAQKNPEYGESFSKLNVIRFFRGGWIFELLTMGYDEYRGELKYADILIALPSAICCEEIRDVGLRADKFIVLHDDAHQLTESEVWATVLGLSSWEKCEGLIMSTDVKEWPLGIATISPMEKRCIFAGRPGHRHYQMEWPWMRSTWFRCISECRDPPGPFQTEGECQFQWVGGTNEFAEQTGLTLVARLLRQGFPSVMLKNQHRVKEPIAKLMNALVYKANPLAGILTGKPSPDLNRFHNILRAWLGLKALGKDMSVIFLEASSGKAQCIKERETTKSKRNHRNVDVVYELLVKNHREKGVKADDIKIVTPYKDQVRLYELEFKNRADESGVGRQSLPTPMTLDTLRGRQARVIIYDLVVTCGDDEHGLGIVDNDFRTSVALTRASDTLIIVGSHELVTLFPIFWAWMNRRIMASNPPPLMVRFAERLKAAGLSFVPSTPQREPCAFIVQEEWIKPDEKKFGWENDCNNNAGERD